MVHYKMLKFNILTDITGTFLVIHCMPLSHMQLNNRKIGLEYNIIHKLISQINIYLNVYILYAIDTLI